MKNSENYDMSRRMIIFQECTWILPSLPKSQEWEAPIRTHPTMFLILQMFLTFDFDSQANPQDIVQMDNDSHIPDVEIPLVELGVGDTLADGTAQAPSVPIGVRRSHVSASK